MKMQIISAVLLSAALATTAVAANKSEPVTHTQTITVGKSQAININSASAEELTLLSGIGETKANAIVEYRNTHGKFKSVNDLAKVKGIGEKLLEQNRTLISL